MSRDAGALEIIVYLSALCALVVWIVGLAPPAPVVAPIPEPVNVVPVPAATTITREFTVATCNDFAKDFLRLNDFSSRVNLCVRLAILIKLDRDPGNLLPQPLKTEPKICSLVLYTDAEEIPKNYFYYAYVTFNRVCFPIK